MPSYPTTLPVVYYGRIPANALPEPYCHYQDEQGWLDEETIECIYPGDLVVLKEEYEWYKIKLAAAIKHRVLLKSLEGDAHAKAQAKVLYQANKLKWLTGEENV